MDIIESLKKYILEILGVKISLVQWENKGIIPFYLINIYDIYETNLLNIPYLFVINKENVEITPATIKIHLDQIQKKSEKTCIFIQKTTTSYNRKRFIEHHIPFIIPGNQMYLPEIGVDLREFFKKSKKRKNVISPATQAVIINSLLNKNKFSFTLSELAYTLNYTSMTISRVIDELECLEIGNSSRKGKERILSFEASKSELWEKSKEMMRSPVKKRIWVKGEKPKVQSGLSALSKITQIASPNISTYAIGSKEWKMKKLVEFPDREGATFELEVWHYDPSLFAINGVADPYSLYLSLQDSEEERVEAALEEMMENIK